ncbi:hypothetical protein HanIR_Chr09g0437471 [Helianthus annuus]|nr:hypothetical protein HanIR_Chr09g0437471 [Helianthus annuus]
MFRLDSIIGSQVLDKMIVCAGLDASASLHRRFTLDHPRSFQTIRSKIRKK